MTSSIYFVVVLCLTSGLCFGGDADCKSDCCDNCKSCPPGWTEFEKKCYQYNGAQKTWAEAEVACLGSGGNLASLPSENVYKFIQQMIQTVTNKDERVWVGAHDTTNENVWLWSNGDLFSYKPWSAGQPDNAGKNEHCMEINFKGAANDLPCGAKRSFVCGMSL